MDAIKTGSASEATLGLTAIARHLCLPGGDLIHFFLDQVDGSSQLEDFKYGKFITSLFEERISNRSVVYLTRGPLRSLLIILVGVCAIGPAKLALI